MVSEQQPDWRALLEFVTYYEPADGTWVCQAVLRDGPQGRRVVLSEAAYGWGTPLNLVQDRAESLTWHREGNGKAARWVPDVEDE